MKKLINYYLPIAIYYATFLFIVASIFFVKRTPETSTVVIEYERNIFSFVAKYILMPVFGFAYAKYFFDILLLKFNMFLLKKQILTEGMLAIKQKSTEKVLNLITASIFTVFLILIFIL